MAQMYGVLVLTGVFLMILGWWVLVRRAPNGGFGTTLAFLGYQLGVTRRQMIPALAFGSLMFLPLIRHGVGGLSILYVLSAGVFGGGVLTGAVSLANRRRARLVLRAPKCGEVYPRRGPCVVAGTAEVTAGNQPLSSPVTRRDAVVYTAFVAQPDEGSGSSVRPYYTTDFITGRMPFEVVAQPRSARVDPAGAWLSLAPASPTNVGFQIEGAFTGGPAEHEVVVDEGETVPDHLRGEESPFSGPLPIDHDGTAEREIRFKENLVEPGGDVVVVGDAGPSREFGTSHLTCESAGAFVASADYEQVAGSLRRTMRGHLAYASTLAVLGGAGLALLTF